MHHDDIVMEHEFIENYNHGVVAVIICQGFSLSTDLR